MRVPHLHRVLLCVVVSLAGCGEDAVTPPDVPGVAPPAWREIADFPPEHTLYAVWLARADYAIAVGPRGRVVRWDGLQWASIENTSTRHLYAIAGRVGGETVAVGDAGTIVRYDGIRFVLANANTTEHLRGLWTAGDGEFIAVGTGGAILRGDGVTWLPDVSPTVGALFGVWGSGPGDVFAVGAHGRVLHHDGVAWTTMTSGSDALLAAVAGTGPRDVYAVGAAGTVLHYDGNAWSAMASGSAETLQGVSAGGRTIAVGSNGAVLEMAAGAWHAQPPLTHEWLYGVAQAGTTTWVVGARAVLTGDGTAWKAETRGAVPLLTGVAGPPGAPLRVAGESGYMVRRSADAWVWEDTGDTRPFHAIWCSPDGDVYAVGRNRILRHDGIAWTVEREDIADHHDVNGGPSGIYAVGVGGSIVRRSAAGAWTVAHPTTPVADHLHAYASVASDQAYIVGDNGRLLRFNGVAWAPMTARAPAHLYDAIAGLDRELIPAIAVGFGGTIVGIAATGTWPMDSPTSASLLALARGPGGRLYAVGQSGIVITFDGEAWAVAASPTLKTLRAAWGDGESLFVVGGEASSGPVLLRYGPP